MPPGHYERTLEIRAKMRALHLGRTLSDEHRAKLSVAHTGYVRSAEHQEKLNLALTGRSFSEAHHEKLKASWTKKRRLRCSKLWKNRKFSDESRAKMSATRRAKIMTGDILLPHGNPSKLAWRAYDLLLKDFEVVVPEARFGPYSVDFLLAEEGLGIEIDGSYWHKGADHTERDAYLLREHGLPIVRLNEEEINGMD